MKQFNCSENCKIEFEIVKAQGGRKIRQRFVNIKTGGTTKWNYILGHKVLNEKFSELEIFEKIEKELMPKFLAEPQAKALIKAYEL